ncbi:MAG TPA: histidinol-phosphate transaminase [Polyangiaceae bacterium]|jgi:histidinol-phosphate aminotransferase|nr:histidinol-phosphate transaminase [Polyangiaceae bacterium]
MSRPLARSSVRALEGYVPGEQPLPGARVVKLNTNENPYPPSPRVLDAIRAVPAHALQRYPRPMADEFRAAASRVLGVPEESILAGNGSDDILTIATRTFLAPGDALAYPEPTYSLYPVLAKLQDARIVTVPWAPGWSLPIEALVAAGARAIYLANPNAPTGTLVPVSAVEALARAFEGVLLVDEAYVDFADHNCLELALRLPNVVVSRTLSKSYSLAGLRFGFAVARPEVVAEMVKVKDSYNCDALSIAAAAAAIADQDYARGTWAKVRAERARLTHALEGLGWSVLPSQANFVLATVPGGRAAQVLAALKARGVLVRYFDAPGLDDKLRITVGTSDDTDALLAALTAL